MRRFLAIGLAAGAAILAGCATQRQEPIGLDQSAIGTGAGRIGIIMSPLPSRDTAVPGANCLLCFAVATQANSAISDHAKSLDIEKVARLKNEFAEALRKTGSDVVVIDEPIRLEALPDHNGTGLNAAPKSYAVFKQRYQIDRLLVLNVMHVGFVRTYFDYVPTSDPKGSFRAIGYMINLATNRYDWYHPVDIRQVGSEKWDNPPRFPELTNAYYQAIEMGKHSLLTAISTPANAGRTPTDMAQPTAPARPQVAPAAALPPAAAAAVPALAPMLVSLQPNSGKQPQAGDEWEYLARDNLFGKQKKLVWRVTKVDSSGVVEQLSVDGATTQDWLFTGQVAAIGAPIEMGFLFGQHWTPQTRIPETKVHGELGGCARAMNCVIEGKVKGPERITIAAGTFDAVRFDGELIYKHLALQPRGHISIWYSEKDRRLLKQVASMRSDSGKFDETVELQAARTYQATNQTEKASEAVTPQATTAPAPVANAIPTLVPMTINGKKPRAGDEWEYLARDNLFGKQKKLTWRVKTVEAAGVQEELLVDGISATQWLFDAKASVIGMPIDSGLMLGQHWSGSLPESMGVAGTGTCATRYNCTVVAKFAGYERITVPAGTYDSIRIDGTVTMTLPPVAIATVRFWYSEKDRRLLKQTFQVNAAAMKVNETLELQVARTYQ